MKTDEFSDAIRRKLDSVSPPFQEKKWVQFQHFMRQSGFPPSVWQSPQQWWQPALIAATVAGLLVVSVWQYQANKTLNQHVQTLTRSMDRLEKSQTTLQQSVRQLTQATPRPDTVYVVQQRDRNQAATPAYMVRPERMTRSLAQAETDRESAEKYVHNPGNVPGSGGRQRPAAESLLTQRSAPAPQYGPGRGPGRLIGSSPATPQPTNTTGLSDTRFASPKPVPKAPDLPVATAQTRLTNNEQPDQRPVPNPVDGPTRRSGSTPSTNATAAHDNIRYIPSSALPTPTNTVNASKSDTYASTGAVDASAQPIPQAVPQVIQLLTPVGLANNSEALEARWASRLRRVRYVSPYAPAVVAAIPANRPAAPPIQWRLGPGGDIGTDQLAVSVNAEAVIGHWAISAGVGQSIWRGDAFQTEAQFAEKTRRDFRKQYPNNAPMPPTPALPRSAVDISRSGRALLIPLQVGYRLAVGKQLQLVPFVGLNLSLNASETIHFDYEKPFLRPRDTDDVRQRLNVNRPLGWYSSWTAGFSAERQWGHFVGQLSPFAALPLSAGEPSLNTASIGLRARAYYQF